MKKLLSMVSILALLMAGAAGCSTGSDNSSSATPKTGSATADIVLGDTISINGTGAVVDGRKVIIESPGTYTISGTLDDGMIKVDAEDASVNLVLAGADITNLEGPAILFEETDQATVTLKEGTSNSLTDGGSSDYDAVLYCEGTLTINGSGSLDIDANNNEGISSTMHINIEGGSIKVLAVEDGLNADNDGVSEINVSGGYLYVESENGDGIDCNGKINISGGTVIALSALTDASGGLDADGEVTVTGGTVIATGARNSTPGSSSTQKSIQASFSGTQSADTLVAIQNAGATILAFAPARDFQSLVYSSAALEEGLSYDVYTGGSFSGTAVDGLYSDGAYTPGTLASTVTTESVSNAMTGQQGGPQGGPQGMPQGQDQGTPPDMSQGTPPDQTQAMPQGVTQ